jgi:hypothetical protein
VPRKRRIQKHRDPCRSRDGVEQQLKPFSPDPRFAVSHPSEVTTRMRDTFHNPKPDRIRHERKNDRDRELRILERGRSRRSDRNDYIRPLYPDLCDKIVQPTGIAFSAQKLNLRRAVILVAKFGERFDQQMDRRAVGKSAVKNCNPRQLRCAGRCQRCADWPGGRRAKKCDEITPPHSSPKPLIPSACERPCRH